MEYILKKKLLENTSNQSSEFRTNNWVEINDDVRETCNEDSQIKFKTSMLKSLCDYSDADIFFKGTVTVALSPASSANPGDNNKKVLFQNCAPFIDCISEINNTQIDNGKDIDAVMPMYNLIEYIGSCSKTLGYL